MSISRYSLFLGLGFWCCAANAASLVSYLFTTPAGSPGKAAGVASNPDGTNNTALFYGPAGLAVDNAGNLFLTDGGSIRKVTRIGANWVVTTLAGTGVGHAAVDGTNSVARFNSPFGIVVDPGGNLYVADTFNHAIRKVAPVGTNWVVTTLAGMTNNPGSADGTNFNAGFNTPYGIAIDAATNLYVADTFNNTIRLVRQVGTNWVVTTLAGMAGASGNANGSNSVARFNGPAAVAVDSQDYLYVADYNNQTIRRIAPYGTNWIVTTIAGSVTNSGSADGSNSVARFFLPQALVMDSANNLYVSDSGNATVRQCSPLGTNWVVTTVAGTAGVPGYADGLGTNALLNNPWGLVADAARNLYVLDNYEYTLRFGRVAYSLGIATASNQVTISWATNAAAYILETSTTPNSGLWIPLTIGITTSGATFVLTTNLGAGNAFYRLHKL